MAPLVSLKDVSKTYGIYKVLHDVSFSLKAGEVFGYIGPNGAGKTTTLKILAGLMPKYEGAVTVGGLDVRTDRENVHKLIGFLPQAVGFQNWRTVDSALRTLGTLSGVESKTLTERISYWLERFDLLDAQHKKVKALSGGMAQKLGLIQALLHEPKLLILDEPLAGLDPVGRNLVKTVVRERRAAGSSVIFSSHILSDLQDIADSVGILADGNLLASGSVYDLKTEFGMPVDVAVEFSKPPQATAFLTDNKAVARATERRVGDWLLRLADGADSDVLVAELIERSTELGGKIRRIGSVEPNLDDLYVKYVAAHREEVSNVSSSNATSAA